MIKESVKIVLNKLKPKLEKTKDRSIILTKNQPNNKRKLINK